MSRPLPRYLEPDDFQHKLARILIQTGQPAPTPNLTLELADPQDLRGIPCIARGVGGTSPGTNPATHVLRLDNIR